MLSKAPGEIITFYSYKGGTGRSMALSNVACILSESQSKGKGVLMIDWDLEAPGLHRFFHDKFKRKFGGSNDSVKEFILNPGLIDLFLELECLTPKIGLDDEQSEKSANEVLESIDLEKFVIETDIPHLSLLKAGCFDENYSTKVNTFNWEDLYNRSPYLFISFAEKLVREYKYVLIDSRTGYTDISGICTSLMPQKLVVVFTPNRQNYTGVSEIIRAATDYRRKSEDLRPLLVYPLPTRIEASRDNLRAEWRFGNPEKSVTGYQPMFESLFKEVYGIRDCDLNDYFEEVQIQQSPDYAYGEEIAIMLEKIEDRFSLSKSYRVFTGWIFESSIPWQRLNHEIFLKTKLNTKSYIPYSRNLRFTGREKELEQIHDFFSSDKEITLSQPVAICGLGGIGKTQIVLEYTYRYMDDYAFVLWVRADSKDSIISDYVSIAKFLDLPVKDNSNQNLVVSAVKKWLSTNDNWLLVLDNINDPYLIESFLPGNTNGHILLTSRARFFDYIEIARLVEMEEMSSEEAKDFLLKRTGRTDVDEQEIKALEELIHEMGCLPLALEQAGVYIYTNNSSFKEYLASYYKYGLKLLEKSFIDKKKYPESISSTWLMNLSEVKKNSEISADILYASAFLYPHQIPLEIFYKGAHELGPLISAAFNEADSDPLIFDEILKPLWQYSLINREAGCRTYDVQRLLQAVLRDGMNKNEQRLWAERVIKAVSSAFPDIEYKNWELCDKLLPHAQTCAEYIRLLNIETEESAKLLNTTGSYLHKRARFKESESLLKSSLEIRKKVLNPEHFDISESLNNLGELYSDLGRYSEAELLYLRALEVREKILEPDDPAIAESISSLAGVYRELGRYSKAKSLYTRALKITEKAFGPENPQVGYCLSSLATINRDLHQYPIAESLYTRALEITEKSVGPENPGVAVCLNGLATVYRDLGRYSEAEPLYTRALKITEKVLGPEHPDVAICLNSLATVYSYLCRYSEAELLYTRALEITEKALGPQHPYVGNRLNNLAGVYCDLGRYSEAEPLYIRALEITEKALGPEHLKVAICLKNLALFFHKQGKYLKARPYYEQAIRVFEINKGENILELAGILDDYASLLDTMKKNKESITKRNRAKGIHSKLGKKDNK